MEARNSHLLRFLDGGDKNFIIPVYQRNYSWKKQNCELLLKDLKSVYKNKYNSHFFGSVVFVTTNVGGIDEYSIIDGQQRVTTISLILLAIRNYLINSNRKDVDRTIIDKIYENYLTDKYAKEEKKLKLKLVKGDDEAYEKIVKNDELIETSNLTANYKFFYNEISKMDGDQIEGIYEAIKKLNIVSISLNPIEGDDPQLIFESLNSTGLALEESDKIRNYVLMKQTPQEQERLYSNYWMKIEEKTKEETTKFIRHYLAVKTRNLPSEARLYFTFKDYCEKQINTLTMEEVLVDVLKYANYYDSIKNGNINLEYMKIIKRIDSLDVGTIYPIYLDLFEARNIGELNDDDFVSCLQILESFISRRSICELSAAPLNKLFTYIGYEIETYQDKYDVDYLDAFKYTILSKATTNSRFPSDKEFADKFKSYQLYNAKSSFRKYVLERLENYKNRETIEVYKLLEDQTLTIEHIMPQKLTPEWKSLLGEEWSEIHEKYLNTIGNLTLSAYNSDYSNMIFEKKRDLQDKGFKFSKLFLNQYVKQQEKWTKEEIEARASIMINKALHIWPMFETDFRPESVEEWYTIEEDDIDYTNKTISKIKLMDMEIVTKDITDVYKKVFDIIYTMDSVNLLKNQNKYWGTNSAIMRKPFEIKEGFYLELNLSSQEKLNRIRDLFKIVKLDLNELTLLVKEKRIFDLYDFETYKDYKIGKLAELVFENVLGNELIDEDLFQQLFDKEYCIDRLGVYYPVLATNRFDNKGNSHKNRYYTKSIKYKDKKVYLTSEWKDSSFGPLITWIKEILKIKSSTN